jgi:DNA end-binding protein Ku
MVKGYESAKGTFVVIEEEEIARLRPASTRVVEISRVVNASTIDPIYIERAYYLAPDSQAAGSPFAVFRDALDDKAGVGHLALHGREYLVAVIPRNEALLLYTLRTAAEVRDMESIDELAFAHVKVRPEEMKLARQVLSSLKTSADLSSFTDHYEEALRKMIAEKDKGEEIPDGARRRPPGVVKLMDALRQSLAQVSAIKKRPVHASARSGARVVTHPSSKRIRNVG